MSHLKDQNRPFVSLSMIVKNEEGVLARCLESARQIADELVVIDTGSTDRTVEIARSFGAKVHFFEWCDDFAAARNFALEHCHGEWILHLDADEIAIAPDAAAVRAELARQPEHVLFMRTTLRNERGDGLSFEVYAARRLFRRHPSVRWARPIHECIGHVEGDAPEMDASCATLTVHHDGYVDESARAAAGKQTRNMRMLKQMQRENPDDTTVPYYLAVEYGMQGRFEAALRIVRQGIAKFGPGMRVDYLGALYCQAIRYALALNRPRLAIKLGKEMARIYAFSELCYLIGSAYFRVKNLSQAERYFELAMAVRSRFSEYSMDAGTGSWKPMIELAWVAFAQDRTELALERLRVAYEWMPDLPLTNVALGRGLLAAKRPAEAEPYLRRAVELQPKLRDGHYNLIQALMAQEKGQEAYDHADALVRAQPERDEYWQWLGEVLYECDELQGCVEVLGQAIARHQNNGEIYNRLGAALKQLGRHHDALNAFALAAAIDPKSQSARAGLAASAHAIEWGVPDRPAPSILSIV